MNDGYRRNPDTLMRRGKGPLITQLSRPRLGSAMAGCCP